VNLTGRPILFFSLLASVASVAAQPTFSGAYSGTIDGKPASLVLYDAAGVLTGQLTTEGGYTVQLRGSSSEAGADGGASSPMGVGTFELRPGSDGVTLSLEEMAPVSGVTVRTEFIFSKSGSEPRQATADDRSMKRDPRLIGVWQGSRMHQAGDTALQLKASLVLHADGSFRETADLTDRGRMSMVREGEWGSAAGALRVRPRGANDWLLLGRYQIRDDQLVLIDSDGQSEVWQRP
jgi:hypothetical protein